MRFTAASKYDRGEKCGAEANMAKLLASEAAWEAADVCMSTYGGYGFARDYDMERKFRETRLLVAAPVSNNMVLAFLGQNVLGMPKSYWKGFRMDQKTTLIRSWMFVPGDRQKMIDKSLGLPWTPS